MPDKPSKKPSLADIAERVGVSPMTVSRALRGLPKVSKEVQRQVIQAAAQMGYEHDMEISRVMRLMRQSRSDMFYESIAFIGLCPKALLIPGGGFFADMLQGARRRAQQQCYSLDVFHLEDFVRRPGRLCDILRSRGIRGVLLSPRMHPDDSLPFDLEGLIPVGLGHTHPKEHFNLVRFNHFSGMTMSCRRLRQLGYRRLGLIADADVNQRMDGRFSAAFITHCGDSFNPTGGERVFLQSPLDPEAVVDFVRTVQPDAVIGGHSEIYKWLINGGIRIPEDVAFATMNYSPHVTTLAGIDQCFEDWGSRAVDLLGSLLRQPATNMNETSLSLLVEGAWRDGPSAPGRLRVGQALPTC